MGDEVSTPIWRSKPQTLEHLPKMWAADVPGAIYLYINLKLFLPSFLLKVTRSILKMAQFERAPGLFAAELLLLIILVPLPLPLPLLFFSSSSSFNQAGLRKLRAPRCPWLSLVAVLAHALQLGLCSHGLCIVCLNVR